MNELNIPADIIMDDLVLHDTRNGVVTQSRLVFDAARGRFVQRLVSLLPDFSVARTNIFPTGDARELVKLLHSPEPASIELELENFPDPVRLTMRLDPRDSHRFFFRLGEDLLIGAGERVSEYCPWCAVAAVAVVAAAGTGVAVYAISEGYDVDMSMEVDAEERTGKADLSVKKHDPDADSG